MGEAWVGVIGTIVGTVIGGLIGLAGQWLASNQARQTRRAEREQQCLWELLQATETMRAIVWGAFAKRKNLQGSQVRIEPLSSTEWEMLRPSLERFAASSRLVSDPAVRHKTGEIWNQVHQVLTGADDPRIAVGAMVDLYHMIGEGMRRI